MTKNEDVAVYTEYFCYVLSGKLTSEEADYLFVGVPVYFHVDVRINALPFYNLILTDRITKHKFCL